MSTEHADIMTALIVEHRLHRVLELGFHHGVSTCYIAAALDELGGGSLTTVDLEHARHLAPNVETLLGGLGLLHLVSVHYEPASYLWRLMKMLEAEPQPRFDLCYIDGAHSWATDGLAFFLVDRILAPGGWIVFDDLDWTFATSPGLKRTEMVRAMPREERETPQVRRVYELLAKTHGSYDELVVRRWLGSGQKVARAGNGARARTRARARAALCRIGRADHQGRQAARAQMVTAQAVPSELVSNWRPCESRQLRRRDEQRNRRVVKQQSHRQREIHIVFNDLRNDLKKRLYVRVD
jgi:predicted O-methyltransferase YrrM